VHTQCDSPGSSTRHVQRTFLCKYQSITRADVTVSVCSLLALETRCLHLQAGIKGVHIQLLAARIHTYIQTNLYSTKIVETNQRRWHKVTRQ